MAVAVCTGNTEHNLKRGGGARSSAVGANHLGSFGKDRLGEDGLWLIHEATGPLPFY